MKSIKIFGIKNCNTMKKATSWLDDHAIDFQFHDYKKAGIDEASLRDWLSKAAWDQLINRRGTTWRKLSDEQKSDIDNDKAVELMMSNTSLIKRPVLAIDGEIHLGFDSEHYEQIFSAQ